MSRATPVVTERDSKFQVSYTVGEETSAFRCVPAAADLFCAAPDLLAACEHSLRNIESMLHMLPLKADATERLSLEAWGHILRAAIARATGSAS